MSDFVFWLVIGLGVSVMLYGLPIAIAGLFFGMDAIDPLRLPPLPPSDGELARMRAMRARRARYFEDIQ